MRVSIVTVCFNSAATIRDSIESVLAQTHDDIEYIIVDGASTDNTLDILSEYTDGIAKVISEPDEGIYDAMNKGIRAATGDIVGILNSDDYFSSPDVLEHVAASFGSNNAVDIVFGDLVYVSLNDLMTVRRYYSSRKFKPWKLRFGYMPPHPATFVRKEVYDTHGLYTLKYRITSDFEIYVRWLYVAGLNHRRLDRVLVDMRPGGLSTSGFKASVELNGEMIAACNDNGLYTNWLFFLLKVPFRLLELWRRPKPHVRGEGGRWWQDSRRLESGKGLAS